MSYFRQSGGKGNLTTTLVRLAEVEIALGNLEKARRYADEALQWADKLNMLDEKQKASELLTSLTKLLT